MYNIGESLSGDTRNLNFKKLVVRNSSLELKDNAMLKMVKQKEKSENHCFTKTDLIKNYTLKKH
jgi:hypothetical protein